ncbi:MAG: TonB-dependent receptor [Bacteroidales bacterium]|nr:TonB-dependent receptor [Bacteroidales bacterium]
MDEGKTYIIKIFAITLLLVLTAISSQAQILMTGTVREANGSGMVGAYICVEGTNIVTLTDLEGKYSLSVPESYADRNVTISYAGYITETFEVAEGNRIIVMRNKETQRIEEMLVSTQKRKERLVEVPIALSVIDSAKIRQTSLYGVDEMSNFVPGFKATVPDAQVVFYNIRGVSSEEPESYGQSRISVFMDGVSISRIQCATMEQYDMERVEVARGPQGTLYGRGAELGAVEFIRKKPTDEFCIDLALLYGNYNQRKAVGVVNTPAGRVFSNRFAFDYNYHDGFIKNEAGGRLNGTNTIALRNSSTFHLGTKTNLHLVFDYQKDDAPGYSYQSKTQFNSRGEVTTTTKSPFTTANLNLGNDLYMKRDIGGFLMQFDSGDADDKINFSSTSGVRAFDTDEIFDVDGTMLDIVNAQEKTKGFQVSEELRCNWKTSSEKVNGFFGASYFYERNQHNYNFSGNLHYIFPLALGKNMKTKLSDLPEEIITNVEQIITDWAVAQKETFKPYADLVVNDKRVGDIMDEVITTFATNVSASIRSQVTSQFSKWFDVIYWEQTPDFFNDTKSIITTTLYNEITRLLDEDTYNVKFLFETLNMDGVSILKDIDFDSGLEKLRPYSAVELTDYHAEDETDYNRTNEASVFADVSWNFAPNFYLRLGVRGIYETSKTGYSSTSLQAPLIGKIIYTSTNGQISWTDKNYKSWVGRAVLNWMFNANHNLYLSAAKGRRPGMIYFNYDADSVVTLNPELTYSYELGVKGITTYGHLSYSIAVYYYDWKNFQISVAARGAASSSGSLTYVSDDNGNAYGAGAELSGTYIFNDDISLFADFSYSGGTFRDKDMNGKEQALAGNKFPMMPEYMYDMGLNWKYHLSNGKVLYFNPSFYTQSKIFFDVANNPDLVQGSYILLNANAGIQWTKGRLSYDVGIYGRNITNTQYAVDGGNAGEVVGLPTFEVGAPATYYLSFRIHLK